MDLETGKFDSKSEEDKIIYLAELSNSLVERLRFVEITEKPLSVFGRPMTKEGKRAEFEILPEVTPDSPDPQGGPDSLATITQKYIREATLKTELQLAKNIFLQADYLYKKLAEKNHERADQASLLGTLQTIQEWCQSWAEQRLRDSTSFRSERQSEMTSSLLVYVLDFFTSFLHPFPRLDFLQKQGIMLGWKTETLNSLIWGLLDDKDLKNLANYAYELASEPVQPTAYGDEDNLQSIINETVTQIEEMLQNILERKQEQV